MSIFAWIGIPSDVVSAGFLASIAIMMTSIFFRGELKFGESSFSRFTIKSPARRFALGITIFPFLTVGNFSFSHDQYTDARTEQLEMLIENNRVLRRILKQTEDELNRTILDNAASRCGSDAN